MKAFRLAAKLTAYYAVLGIIIFTALSIFPVLREAHNLHADITFYGERGVDYLWEDEA